MRVILDKSPFRQECLRVLCPYYTWIPQEDRHKCLTFTQSPSGIELCWFICNGQKYFIINIYNPIIKKIQWLLYMPSSPGETVHALNVANTLEELMVYFIREEFKR